MTSHVRLALLSALLLLLPACGGEEEDPDAWRRELPNQECETTCVEDQLAREMDCVAGEVQCVQECGGEASTCARGCIKPRGCWGELFTCTSNCECSQGASDEERRACRGDEFSPFLCASDCLLYLSRCKEDCLRLPNFAEGFENCMDVCADLVINCEQNCIGAN